MKKKPQYISGQEIMTGDVVTLDNEEGIIVFVIPSNQFSDEYPQKEWEYLKEGFGIETEKFGLIHQIDPDEDLEFIKRKE